MQLASSVWTRARKLFFRAAFSAGLQPVEQNNTVAMLEVIRRLRDERPKSDDDDEPDKLN